MSVIPYTFSLIAPYSQRPQGPRGEEHRTLVGQTWTVIAHYTRVSKGLVGKKQRVIIDWYIMNLRFSQIVLYEILWNDLVPFQIVEGN